MDKNIKITLEQISLMESKYKYVIIFIEIFCLTGIFSLIISNLGELKDIEVIEFRTIRKGWNCGVENNAFYVINSQNEWEDLWIKTYSTQSPLPDIPSIDFNTTTIVAVYRGTFPTSGYDIEIVRIIKIDSHFEIYIKKGDPSPNMGVLEVITHPYHIIKTQKITLEAKFLELKPSLFFPYFS
ncbi:MAG: protease complex subunit PrcB family protein [Promethearchaeota archaeon]